MWENIEFPNRALGPQLVIRFSFNYFISKSYHKLTIYRRCTMKTLTTLSLFLLLSFQAYSQDGNITNTLGANGVFSIKDNTTTFFSLHQDDGRISLPDLKGSKLGFIYKNSMLFIHNYAPIGTIGSNTFLGVYAGNTTMNGIGGESNSNTGIGFLSLTSLTTGSNNTAVGDRTLTQNTSGGGNTAIGNGALSIV